MGGGGFVGRFGEVMPGGGGGGGTFFLGRKQNRGTISGCYGIPDRIYYYNYPPDRGFQRFWLPWSHTRVDGPEEPTPTMACMMAPTQLAQYRGRRRPGSSLSPVVPWPSPVASKYALLASSCLYTYAIKAAIDEGLAW